MKTVLLLRHAKSDWGQPGLSDFDRPLATRGMNDAPRMGETLDLFNTVPDQILASPAKRAKQTAEIVAQNCGYTGQISWHPDFYGGGSTDLISALQQLPSTVGRAMLVGHNPTMEETAANLLCGDGEGWASCLHIRMPTAALVCLDFDIRRWEDLVPGEATLRWYIIPKLIKAIT